MLSPTVIDVEGLSAFSAWHPGKPIPVYGFKKANFF